MVCRYKGKFELTYVSKSTVVVKALSTGSRTVVSSGVCSSSRSTTVSVPC